MHSEWPYTATLHDRFAVDCINPDAPAWEFSPARPLPPHRPRQKPCSSSRTPESVVAALIAQDQLEIEAATMLLLTPARPAIPPPNTRLVSPVCSPDGPLEKKDGDVLPPSSVRQLGGARYGERVSLQPSEGVRERLRASALAMKRPMIQVVELNSPPVPAAEKKKRGRPRTREKAVTEETEKGDADSKEEMAAKGNKTSVTPETKTKRKYNKKHSHGSGEKGDMGVRVEETGDTETGDKNEELKDEIGTAFEKLSDLLVRDVRQKRKKKATKDWIETGEGKKETGKSQVETGDGAKEVQEGKDPSDQIKEARVKRKYQKKKDLQNAESKGEEPATVKPMKNEKREKTSGYVCPTVGEAGDAVTKLHDSPTITDAKVKSPKKRGRPRKVVSKQTLEMEATRSPSSELEKSLTADLNDVENPLFPQPIYRQVMQSMAQAPPTEPAFNRYGVLHPIHPLMVPTVMAAHADVPFTASTVHPAVLPATHHTLLCAPTYPRNMGYTKDLPVQSPPTHSEDPMYALSSMYHPGNLSFNPPSIRYQPPRTHDHDYGAVDPSAILPGAPHSVSGGMGLQEEPDVEVLHPNVNLD
eukprot:Platyproteum_vivax@DN5576_c0_g1_i3.p1